MPRRHHIQQCTENSKPKLLESRLVVMFEYFDVLVRLVTSIIKRRIESWLIMKRN